MADNTYSPSDHGGAREHHHFLSNTNNPSPPHATVGPSNRPRGRPLGSKNKPKPPIVITQESEDSLKPVLIEIPVGKDVIDALITFAHHHRVSITILSASGSVNEITLRHHVSRASIFPIHGTCRIVSLTGYFVGAHLGSSNDAAFHPCSSFGIMVAGPQGQVFGGLIGGSVIAASVVMVVATVSKNPQFHRLPFINENIVDENGGGDDNNNNNNNNGYVGAINNVDRSGGNNNNNNNGMAMIPNMSGFDIATSSTGQVPIADINVMQWNHFNRLPYH